MELLVLPENDGIRLDAFLTEHVKDLTRTLIQKYIACGAVLLNGKPETTKSRRLTAGSRVAFTPPPAREPDVLPEEIPLEIVYEDADLLVVNKPKGMVVHPAPGSREHTLVNALLFHCGNELSGIGGVQRPGIVHRIDKDTSGLLVVAKNDYAHQGLSEQLAVHSMTREYQAVVYGTFRDDSGEIDAPIGRSSRDRKKMAVTGEHSKSACTDYRVIERYSGFTHVALRLRTGRTHQIRVHMASIGHPVAGDPVYGPRNCIRSLNGQCLHAGLLGFIHPRTGQYMEFRSPLPPYFTDFLRTLKGGEQR